MARASYLGRISALGQTDGPSLFPVARDAPQVATPPLVRAVEPARGTADNKTIAERPVRAPVVATPPLISGQATVQAEPQPLPAVSPEPMSIVAEQTPPLTRHNKPQKVEEQAPPASPAAAAHEKQRSIVDLRPDTPTRTDPTKAPHATAAKRDVRVHIGTVEVRMRTDPPRVALKAPTIPRQEESQVALPASLPWTGGYGWRFGLMQR
jgi:hypothetical protein